MLRYLLPLGIFIVLVVFLAIGLGRDPHEVPSPLINKAAPTFRLPQLKDPSKTFSAEEMRGKVWILNVWASWCISCRDEHPLLIEYAKSGAVPIYGLNYKDQRDNALQWLSELGDPYVLSAADEDGRVAIDYGVYGAPETYLIDKNGTIRFKQVGAVTPDVWEKTILPLAQELNRGTK
ncbi:MAG TPA: DsbE family thiol:disulfide interchange protein [Pyrinomonadaceae bacterium]|jgi:cytochrome c biogenesis protein CcmG/thiol:disulfide interchange protein DsbE|nr:DsbE family thiol:disulfide interchange protein [Pyrinomonadaceae bacterium]